VAPAGRGKKVALPTVIMRGPFFSSVDTEYQAFKSHIAKVLPCKMSNIPCKQIQWKYEKPNNDKKKPMTDQMGYEAMIVSLKGRTKDLVVNIYMPPPQKEEAVPLKLVVYSIVILTISFSGRLGIQVMPNMSRSHLISMRSLQAVHYQTRYLRKIKS
jgi:hypothetical protein